MKKIYYFQNNSRLLLNTFFLIILALSFPKFLFASDEKTFVSSNNGRDLFLILQEKLVSINPSLTSSARCPRNTRYFPYCTNVQNRGMIVGMGISTDYNDISRPTLTKFCNLMGYETFKKGSGKYSSYSSYNDELIIKFNPKTQKWEKATTNAFWTGFTCINKKSSNNVKKDACNDNADNDGDGLIDSEDLGCRESNKGNKSENLSYSCIDSDSGSNDKYIKGSTTYMKGNATRKFVDTCGVETSTNKSFVAEFQCTNAPKFMYATNDDASHRITTNTSTKYMKVVNGVHTYGNGVYRREYCEYGCKDGACIKTECEGNYGTSKRPCESLNYPICNSKGQCVACDNGVYDTKSKKCVRCTKDEHCLSNQRCENKKCVDKLKQVTPILECVMDNEDGTYSAYFGYENENSQDVTINACSNTDNNINVVKIGSQKYCNMPSTFNEGRVQGAFSVKFNENENVTWTLKNNSKDAQTVKANANSTKCAKVKPIAKCITINQDATLQAYFGYINKNAFEVEIKVGSKNNINPAPKDRGQPTRFFSGKVDNMFNTKLDAPATAWYLDGLVAEANKSLPTCNGNKKPVCDDAKNVTYNTKCQGAQTILDLDGTGCYDPDGTSLKYSWKTDCESSKLENAKSSKATLKLSIPGSGYAQSCAVTLTVTDGLESTSVKQYVDVSSCNVDCPGTNDKKDVCGICGGDGTSCLDCNDVPFGNAKIDSCGVCNGHDECLDCNNVPYGTSKVDRCGVCDGDGLSCLECIETNIAGAKDNLNGDEFILMLQSQTELLLSEGNPYPLIREIESSAHRRIKRAQNNNKKIIEHIAKLSDVVKSCTNTNYCKQNDNEPTLKLIERYLRKLRRQVGRTIRQRNISSADANTLLNENTKILSSKLSILATIPRFYSVCN